MPTITITARKNRSDTGAKNVTRAAKGPGFSFSGSSIPIAWPEIRFVNVHVSAQPFGVDVISLGETVPAGKSMSRKFVRSVRLKSRTCATPVPANA